MIGAVLGDIIGSHYRNNPALTKDFPFKATGTKYTGITVMTIAVAKWLMEDPSHSKEKLVEYMQKLGRTYIRAGYSTQFKEWLLSKNPQSYESNQNEAMLFVSPIGLYASTISEIYDLVETVSSCIHNSFEATKEAATIATCVFHHKRFAEYNANNFQVIGYFLPVIRFKVVRDSGSPELIPQQESYNRSLFDVIKSLHRSTSLEDCIREAVYSGCDPCSVTSMATSIAMAYSGSRDVVHEWDVQFANYLPRDLRRIMVEFENYVYPSKPTFNSYKVNDWLYAGEYPGDKDEEQAIGKLKQFNYFGISHFIDLTEDGELVPYNSMVSSWARYMRFAIRDISVPDNVESVKSLIDTIEQIHKDNSKAKIYVHCWGGVGRTGTIIGCYLGNFAGISYDRTMSILSSLFEDCPKSVRRCSPENDLQRSFIRKYVEFRKTLNPDLENLLQWSLTNEENRNSLPERNKIATKDSWDISPLASNYDALYTEIYLPEWAMAHIKKGRIPGDMNSKYFIYCNDKTINVHRSWLGYCCFVADYSKVDDCYKIECVKFPKRDNTTKENEFCLFMHVLLVEVSPKDSCFFANRWFGSKE